MNSKLAKFEHIVPVKANEQFCVNARQLHEALKVKDHFRTWIKRRIEKYDFQENTDYEKSSIISSSANLRGDKRRSIPINPNPAIEYKITLNMAKELCMVENNEIGKLARRYFIECERRLLEQQTTTEEKVPQNYLEALKALVISEEQKQKQKQRINELEIEVKILDDENQQLKLETGKHPIYHRLLEDKYVITHIHTKAYGQVGMMLKALSAGMRLPIYSIRHSTHKKVLAYHTDVFDAFHDYCETNPKYLAKWRLAND